MDKLESVSENEMNKIIWNSEIQVDYLIPASRLNDD